MSRDKKIEEFGRSFASGMLIEFGKWLILASIGIAAFNWVDRQTHITSWDSTDGPHGKSGLRIRTDHLTGCQYLVTRDGAITARMDGAGKQICGGAS